MIYGGAPQKTAHRYLRLLIVGFTAILVLCVLFLLRAPSSTDYITLEREHFVVKYTQRDETVISDIVAALEGKYPRVVSDLRPNMQPVIQVTIHPDLRTFHRAIGAPLGTPSWVVGMADTDGRSIQMVSPLKPGPSHNYQSMIEVAVHEMVHAVCLNLNPRLADMKWLSESVALYYAGQFRDPKARPYLQRSEFPSVEELNTTTKHYDVGYVLIEFIVAEWGTGAVRDLVVAGGDISDVLGITVSNFESQWHQFIRMKYLGKTSVLPWSREILVVA